jgi:hypothetical protein
VTNQQRRGGADFQYCNDIHESLLLINTAYSTDPTPRR